jgi:UDP-glucose 4-epimerase
MVGADRETFLKGRRCENQGLGIGAFTYYRRVVENQKAHIFDEIIKVAQRIGAPAEMIASLTKAKQEIQFTKAMDCVKPTIPDSLMING